jgi:hypothetical protein
LPLQVAEAFPAGGFAVPALEFDDVFALKG